MFHFGSNLRKRSTHNPEHYPLKEKMLRIMIWHLFLGFLGQSENFYEIKLPLVYLNLSQISLCAEGGPGVMGSKRIDVIYGRHIQIRSHGLET